MSSSSVTTLTNTSSVKDTTQSCDVCSSCNQNVCDKGLCPAYICNSDTCYISFDKLNYFEHKNEQNTTNNTEQKLLVKKLDNNAVLPKKQYKEDAGYDLSACIKSEITINPGERKLIGTGISAAIPVGYYGRIAPRSGLAWKNGIDVLADVIDSGFRNEIMVLLLNTSQSSFVVNNGDRIAQLIIEVTKHLEIEESVELPAAQRNLSGFGSTGV